MNGFAENDCLPILNPNESHSHSKLRKNVLTLTFKVAHQAGAYLGFLSIKRLGIFLLSPWWDASPSQGYPIKFAGTYLYTWVERDTVGVWCLAQEHNTMSPARARTWTARVDLTNHEATAPPTGVAYRNRKRLVSPRWP